MPIITINEQEYNYEEDRLLNFPEGLIGLPEMRQAVLIPMEDLAPFSWLVSVEQGKPRFVVVDPKNIFAEYHPNIAGSSASDTVQTLAIVKISSDWKKTTVNLRAPIYINLETNNGEQVVLNDGKYGFEESIPQD